MKTTIAKPFAGTSVLRWYNGSLLNFLITHEDTQCSSDLLIYFGNHS